MGICNKLTVLFIAFLSFFFVFAFLQAEIVKRLNAICAQVIPFLSQEVRQSVSGTGLKGAISVVLQKRDCGTDALAFSVSWCLYCTFLRYSVCIPTSTPSPTSVFRGTQLCLYNEIFSNVQRRIQLKYLDVVGQCSVPQN